MNVLTIRTEDAKVSDIPEDIEKMSIGRIVGQLLKDGLGTR
jgi:hypothetical protein